MSTTTPDRPRSRPRINTFAIGAMIAIGVVLAGSLMFAGRLESAMIGLAITWGAAAVIYFGSRYSDMITLISDDIHDERHVHIHERASIYTLNLLMFVIVSAFIVDLARGGTGAPYTWLAAFGAVVYISLLIALSRRT